MQISFPRSRVFLWYWLPPLTWYGVVLALSGDLGSSRHTFGILKWLLSWFPPLSPAQFAIVHFYFRKIVGHAANYGFLYFLWFRAFRGSRGYPPGRAFLWSLGLCLTLALLDEGHQGLIVSRSGSLRDVALDMGGAALSALLTAIFWTPRMGPPPGHEKLVDPAAGA